MGTFLVYILKSAACLAVFYLFYKLLMSRDTFHRFNRFALLGLLVLSSLLPLVEASVNSPAAVQETMLTLEQLLLLADIQPEGESMAAATPSATVLWLRAALLVYLTGIVFFIVRNLCSLARLGRLIRQGKREALDSYLPDRKEKNVRLVVHDHDIAPFSWMHWIVIARKDLEENGREILIHELAHIRNRHSWDLLLADLCIFVQWFNPAAWLLKQELQNIHEYEADETVLREGVNARNYQMLLIKKAVGTRLYSMANSFNHSSLKKRITMMLKEKSNPWARAKYLYILPLAALAVTAFARPEVSAVADEISAVKVIAPAVHDSIQPNVQPAVAAPSSALDQMPEFPGGMEALNTYLRNNIRYPQEAQKAGIQGRVIIQFIVSKDGSITDAEVVESVDPQLDAEGLRLIKNMPRWKPGMRKGQAIRVKQTLPIRFAFTKTPDKPENSNSIFLKNGSYNSSLKDVILLVNGQEVSPEIFRAIDPQRIQSVTVLKDQASLAKYTTDKSKTGIIQVKLKKEEQASDINIPTIRFDSQTSKSLVIIDGKAADATAVQALSPSQIKSIKVLKGQQAVDLFGEAAKNGAICVSTRSAESETDK
ncbi:M56 family metallopeptidase [Phocaeicola coprophilus]|jgi:TonB family protein|uniref:TonB family protein n=2 Tax=Phocaeicola coprophilus TaxID=387090 RepID=A0A413SVL4_9BACT|nr:M56 family metallopeptidase [Phocaeicola coprophilus]RHA73051.1 TonB family protein [Phocaeicola coprophilus]